METLHWVREIIEKGPDWFAGHGRHEAGPVDGRAERVHAETAGRGGAASIMLDREASTATSAASSSAAGRPRMMLTRRSVSIDRAYDGVGDNR